MRGFLEYPDFEATARHIEVVAAKIRTLEQARAESWAQLLTSVDRRYRSGDLTTQQTLALHDQMRESYGSGFTRLWNAHMSVSSQKINRAAVHEIRYAPNGPAGSWQGSYWIRSDDNGQPPDGQAVVYVLFDNASRVAYIGSTEHFHLRLRCHWREKPENLDRFVAYPCVDRDAAYRREERMLAEYMPYLNRKATR